MRKLAKKGIKSVFGSWAKLTQLKAIALEKNMFLVLNLDLSTSTRIINIWTTQPFIGFNLQAVFGLGWESAPVMISKCFAVCVSWVVTRKLSPTCEMARPEEVRLPRSYQT
eukprot:316064-Pelagomonas_calceolata.AAC.1